jgi:hypothetical protein
LLAGLTFKFQWKGSAKQKPSCMPPTLIRGQVASSKQARSHDGRAGVP